MKKLIIFSFLFSLTLFSCRKVIDLELKDSEPQYVIKGVVSAGDSVHTVRITQSVAFDQSNVFPDVTGAVVVLKDNLGNTETLTDLGNGNYATVNFPAVAGRIYTLTVTVAGKNFEAVSTIPGDVTLLDLDFLPSNFFGDTGNIIVPKFNDPGGVRNYYLFNFYNLNDPLESSGNIISSDDFSDGQLNQQPFFGAYSPDSGDSVVYQMWGIDEKIYKYYFSFDQNTNGNSGAPANPVTNWNNGALGYFSAQNPSVLMKVAP